MEAEKKVMNTLVDNTIYSLGLGTWSFSNDSYGEITEEEIKKIIFKSMDLGINFFDTSPIYGAGRSEQLLGKYLDKNTTTVATKIGMVPHLSNEIPHDFTASFIVDSVDKSLERLNLEQIHLLQLHSPLQNYLQDYPDLTQTLNNLIDSGKVKNIGISLRSPNLFSLQAQDFAWKGIQFNLSLLDQRIREQNINEFSNNCYKIARTVLNFGVLTTSFKSSGERNANYHLSKWPHEQIDLWLWAAEKMKILSAQYGRTIENFALRFPIDSGLANITLVGAETAVQLESNFNEFNKNPLTNLEIQSVYSAYEIIKTRLVVNSPYKYTSKKD
jgi:aryl-alcohol dehydrogenase-like predicted oxidoreductase